MLRFVKFCIISLFTLLMGVAAGGFYLIYYYSHGLPDFTQLAQYTPPTITRLYASDSSLLAEYAKERRIFVPIQSIPKSLISAFIAAEDKNFYEHPGIDIFGIMRAALQNITQNREERSLVGGSTITQQLVKNFLLDDKKSIERKIKEAILAFRISIAYSKDRILELYLNQIYLGSGSYGVAAASLEYFNKSLEALTIAEMALLASLPKAPSYLNPFKYPERALIRRNWVIKRMEEEQFITPQSCYNSLSEPLSLHKTFPQEKPYALLFAEATRLQLSDLYGKTKVMEEGYYVHTTLDPFFQKEAESAFQQGLIAYDKKHGWRGPITHVDDIKNWPLVFANIPKNPAKHHWLEAIILDIKEQKAIIGFEDGYKGSIPLSELTWARKWLSENALGPEITSVSQVLKVGDIVLVENMSDKKEGHYRLCQIPQVNGGMIIIEPKTGKILALVGGYYEAPGSFNRATQALRQPGSALKPFVYLTALEKGLSPTTLILDGPIALEQGKHLPLWRPQNYSRKYEGFTTLRRALERSYNTVTVRLAQRVGIPAINDVMQRFKIYKKSATNLSFVLGTEETNLLDLTAAYAMIANGGKEIFPSFIEKIQDRNGLTLFQRDKSICTECSLSPSITPMDLDPHMLPNIKENFLSLIDPHVNYQMISFLEGIVARGTAGRAKVLNMPIAGKTGTTNDSMDSWFVGFSPHIAVGVYVGFDTPKTLGKRETGATVALPIFVDFMSKASAHLVDQDFPVPPGIVFRTIDALTGLPPTSNSLPQHIIKEAFVTAIEKEDTTQKDPEKTSPALPTVISEGPTGIY